MQTIKHMGVMSVAKVEGLMGAILGLIIGIVVAVVGTAGSLLGIPGAAFGVLAIIAFPIMYGIGLFIGGAIGAVIYNFIADKIGGIQIDLK